jgi:hypothetical protein
LRLRLLPSWHIQQHLCQRYFSLHINDLRNVSGPTTARADGTAKKSDSAPCKESRARGNFLSIGMSDLRWNRCAHAGGTTFQGGGSVQPDDTIITFDAASGPSDLVVGEGLQDPASEHPIDRQIFHIRMANSQGRREAATLLLTKMYGWRGYDVDPSAQHAMNRITLYAENAGVTAGTMSLCLDDEQLGLPADENFRDKLDELRRQRRRLCEPSRLAIDKGVSMRVFAALIHISYLYACKIHGYTDYVIEVNPRHVMFYKRMLGFQDFGGERNCTRVSAPAVLLRLELEEMGKRIRQFGGQMEQSSGERSFYPYFFPERDVAGITSRLAEGRN